MGLVGEKTRREIILDCVRKAKFFVLYTNKKGHRDFCPVHTDADHAKGIARIFKNNECTEISIVSESKQEFDGMRRKIAKRLKREIAALEIEIEEEIKKGKKNLKKVGSVSE